MIKYLSPSSLKAIEGMPNRFYMERLAVPPLKRDPQSIAMAVGSAFDAILKVYIAEKGAFVETLRQRLIKGIYNEADRVAYANCPLNKLILELCVEPQNRKEAYEAGQYLFTKYMSNGYSSLKFLDIEIHRNFNLAVNGGVVPIFGKADALVADPEDEDYKSPLDWKVSGYGSESGKSPLPGYKWRWDSGLRTGPHEKYVSDLPMEAISDEWALQLCTYGWMSGIPVGRRFRGIIDMFCIRKTKLCVARYIGMIGEEYQERIAQRYSNAWRSLQDGSFMDRVASHPLLMEASMESWRGW